eukprot:6473313-Heterocapsa_arctica.AAC.1
MPVSEVAACPGQNSSDPYRLLEIPAGLLPTRRVEVPKRRTATAKSSPANTAMAHCLPRPDSGRTDTAAARIHF